MKRAVDFLLSAIGLIVLAPVFLVAAIAIKLDSRGPVFFRQRRIGRHLKPFHMLKFRTMVHNAAELGPEDDRLAHLPSWSRPPDDLLAAAETRAALEEALGGLTPLQRAVFELREFEGRTTEETAEALAISPGAVRVHLHRSRLRLRARLAPRFGVTA